MTNTRRLAGIVFGFLFLTIIALTLPFRVEAAGKDDAAGRAASECAKISDPKKKDECVRAAREAAKGEKEKKGKKDEKKSGKNGEKSKKDKAEKSMKEKGEKKAKKEKAEKQKGKS